MGFLRGHVCFFHKKAHDFQVLTLGNPGSATLAWARVAKFQPKKMENKHQPSIAVQQSRTVLLSAFFIQLAIRKAFLLFPPGHLCVSILTSYVHTNQNHAGPGLQFSQPQGLLCQVAIAPGLGFRCEETSVHCLAQEP